MFYNNYKQNINLMDNSKQLEISFDGEDDNFIQQILDENPGLYEGNDNAEMYQK
jgi:hypothetical protein